MSTTEVATYFFSVKEGQPSASGKDDAPVWLMCEPEDRELSIVGDSGFLGIRLSPGTKIEQAHEIVQFLHQHVAGISYTKLH